MHTRFLEYHNGIQEFIEVIHSERIVMEDVEENFFRKDAVESLSNRSFGNPIARMPRVWMCFSLFVVIVIAFTFWYLLSSQYSRKEVALGWLVPDEGVVSITSGRHGVVSKLNVIEGQVVSAGEEITTLVFDGSVIGPNSTTDLLLQEMSKERNEIKRQIRILTESVQLEESKARNQVQSLTDQLTYLSSQLDYQNEIIDIEKELLLKIEKLNAEGSISTLELQRQRESYAVQKQTLQTLLQNISRMKAEKKQLLAQVERLPLDHEKSISEFNTRLSGLFQRETELLAQNKRVIMAPIEGTVAWLAAQPGSSITPNSTLVTIIPKNTNMFAEVFIPSNAIGFIDMGKAVRVMFDAFPHQRFGSVSGHVSHLGRVALSEHELPQQIKLEGATYRARVQLDHQFINAFDREFQFRPGMTLRAEIILENRSFLEWLLEPAFAHRQRQKTLEGLQ